MCGIVGYISSSDISSIPSSEELQRASEAMFLRGPDADGAWVSEDRTVGLAHRRLSIIDLSEGANQPFSDPDKRYHLVYNGEIYNYRALREDLISKGYTFRTKSDTEVLLHLYKDEGVDMVHKLRGMYAFAIWDTREELLFLARDPLGIKPLYYSHSEKNFYFGSQVKSLLKFNGINKEISPVGAVSFFSLGFIPDPYTSFKSVKQLPAGSTLLLKKGESLKISSFLNPLDQWRDENTESEEERVRTLKSALLDSVRHHLVSDVQVGFFLSAGLDSTTLTALASELDISSLQTLTLGFKQYEGGINDEVPLAEEVARHYGTEHKTTWITSTDFKDSLPLFLEAMDQPSIDGLNTYLVSKVAGDADLKVAISGLGGDELFSGYPSFTDIPKIVAFNRWNFSQSLGRAFRLVSEPLLKHFTSPKYAGIFEYGDSYEGAYLLRRGLFMPWELPDLLDPEIVKDGWEEFHSLMFSGDITRDIESPHRKVAALEMNYYMRDQLLRVSDWAGMAHSLEIRVPFVDIEVLKCVSKFSSHNDPLKKLDMTKKLRTPLPDAILNRVKTPFTVPIRDWIDDVFPDVDVKRHGWRAWGRKVWDSYIDSTCSK